MITLQQTLFSVWEQFFQIKIKHLLILLKQSIHSQNSQMNNMNKIKKLLCFIIYTTFVLTSIGRATAGECRSSPAEYKFKPTIIDGSSESGAVVGLEYDVSGEITKCLDSGEDILESDAEITVYQLSGAYKARGILASDSKRNPSDFLDVSTIVGVAASSKFGTFLAGMDAAYEASQDFDNKQLGFSLSATYSKLFDKSIFVPDGAFFSVDTGWGRVEPIDDELRSVATGEEKLSGFYRWSVEGLLNLPTRNRIIKAIEFNVRYFQEVNAPAQVENANLDSYLIWTARLGLPNDFFLAYRYGKLPFDRENDHIVQIGLSFDLGQL